MCSQYGLSDIWEEGGRATDSLGKGFPGGHLLRCPAERAEMGLRQGRPDIGTSKLGALGNHRYLGSQGAEALAELSRKGQKGICKGDHHSAGDPQQIGVHPVSVPVCCRQTASQGQEGGQTMELQGAHPFHGEKDTIAPTLGS